MASVECINTAMQSARARSNFRYLTQFALALGMRHILTQDLDHLRECITHMTRATLLISRMTESEEKHLFLLGAFWALEYRRNPQSASLNLVISYFQEAVDLSIEPHGLLARCSHIIWELSQLQKTEQVNMWTTAKTIITQGARRCEKFNLDSRSIYRFFTTLVPHIFEITISPTIRAFRVSLEAARTDEHCTDREYCIHLLRTVPEVITQPGSPFAWIEEPLSLGFTVAEVIDLILEQQRQTPWICYDWKLLEARSLDRKFHRRGCVHGVSERREQGDTSVTEPAPREVVRKLSEMCGLAGVIPHVKKSITLNTNSDRAYSMAWEGDVEFAGSAAKVTYVLPSDRRLQNATARGRKVLFRCRRVLNHLVAAISWLQANQVICDRIVILRSTSETQFVQCIDIKLDWVQDLRTALESVLYPERLRSDNLKHESLTERLPYCSGRFIISTQELSEMVDRATLGSITETDADRLLELTADSCALAVQVFSVGLLSLGQRHVGKLYPFFLEHSLSRVDLRGANGRFSAEMACSLRLESLSCVGAMLGSRVMVLSSGTNRSQGGIYHLETTLHNLLDLWGPSRVVNSAPDGHLEIDICGGVIYKPSQSRIYHWRPGRLSEPLNPFEVTYDRELVIGAISTLNRACPSVVDPYKTVPRGNILRAVDKLGTRPQDWSLQQIQAGFQAGQFLNPTLNATYIKITARTQKDEVLEGITEDFLEQPWGLLVSVCTGLARRVPLREVIVEVMPSMMAAWTTKPKEWKALAPRLYKLMRKPKFRESLKGFKDAERRASMACIGQVLRKLSWTGIDDHGKLILSAPSYQVSDGCVRMTPAESRPFAGILKDSQYSSAFACLTTSCFVAEEYACRGSKNPQWQSKISALATSVGKYQWTGANMWDKFQADAWDRIPQPGLKEGGIYWFGSLSDKRKVKVRGKKGKTTLLEISEFQTRLGFWLRGWERVERMRPAYVALREMSFAGESGVDEVLVVSE